MHQGALFVLRVVIHSPIQPSVQFVQLVRIHPLLAHQPVHLVQVVSTRLAHQLVVHLCLRVQYVLLAMQVL